MNDNEKLILYYLLMSTGMLPGGFSDLLKDTRADAEIKKYRTAIEQTWTSQNAGNADAK